MLKETKEYLKLLAKEIKELKSYRPLSNRQGHDLSQDDYAIFQKKYKFRHHHIAYCELRGRTRDQIEIPAKNNLANQTYIDKIKKEIVEKYEKQQTICNCA